VIAPLSSPTVFSSPSNSSSPSSGHGGKRAGAGLKPGKRRTRPQLLHLEKARAARHPFSLSIPPRPRTQAERDEVKENNNKRRRVEAYEEKFNEIKERSG
jgi:hypothetical protein